MDPDTNPVVTAIESVNALNLGLAPAFALAQHYAMTAHAAGLQALNQSSAQQQAAIARDAVTAMACAQILAVDVATLSPKS